MSSLQPTVHDITKTRVHICSCHWASTGGDDMLPPWMGRYIFLVFSINIAFCLVSETGELLMLISFEGMMTKKASVLPKMLMRSKYHILFAAALTAMPCAVLEQSRHLLPHTAAYTISVCVTCIALKTTTPTGYQFRFRKIGIFVLYTSCKMWFTNLVK